MEILGIPPGRDVGEAYRFLLELRLDEGRSPPEAAEAALRAWWAERPGEADVPLLEATVEIDTPPARVWALVSDLPGCRRGARWSCAPWCSDAAPFGTHAVNVNRRGPMVWPTRSTVVRFEPDRNWAFRVAENHMVWSFSLSPLDDGTRTHVVQRRDRLDRISSVPRLQRHPPVSPDFTRLGPNGQA